MVLRETAIHVERARSLTASRRLDGLAARVTSSFDSQLGEHPFDLGSTRKINVHVVIGHPEPQEMGVVARAVSSQEDPIAGIRVFAQLRDLADEDTEEQVSRLFEIYASALLSLAEGSGWNARQFEAAIERARASGIKGRLVREAVHRRRPLRGRLNGAVEADGIHLRLGIEDLRSGAVMISEERRAVGDYWEMLDIADKLRWDGDALRVTSNSRSLAHPFAWEIAV